MSSGKMKSNFMKKQNDIVVLAAWEMFINDGIKFRKLRDTIWGIAWNSSSHNRWYDCDDIRDRNKIIYVVTMSTNWDLESPLSTQTSCKQFRQYFMITSDTSREADKIKIKLLIQNKLRFIHFAMNNSCNKSSQLYPSKNRLEAIRSHPTEFTNDSNHAWALIENKFL